jgi:Spy/CpxP family protein refolding chaperone
MHPAFYHWWKHGRRSHCGPEAHDTCGPEGGGCGPGHRGHHGPGHQGWGERGDESRWASGPDEGSAFGVRRPLRFLAHKLDLTEEQVGNLARILNELKTERAQAEVDQRRTISAFADAVAGESFDQAKAGDGATLRVSSAERLKEAVVTALSRIHAILQPEQRERLAYLIRTGVVTL